MAKQLTDDELDLRRKARRRLIGAIALSLAVAVILPMVLDSEPRSGGQDIELRIPAPDKVGEFVPGVASSEVAGTSPFAASAVEAVSSPAPAPVPASAAVKVEQVAAVQDKPAAAREPATQIPVKTQPVAGKQPAPKAADQPVAAEGFVAQVGAYASADTAKQELDKLKKLGFRKAYIEKADAMTRVRVGPYAEREKAEQVRQMLEKHGLKPVVMSVR